MEKICVHYPMCYLLIMEYIYTNLIFASDFIFYLILLYLRAVYVQNLKKTCERWTFSYDFANDQTSVFFMPVAM